MQTPESRPFRVRSAKDFGAAVKHFRMLRGVRQADLAARAGVHRSYLSELEGGHATEAMRYVIVLCNELGLRVTIALDEP